LTQNQKKIFIIIILIIVGFIVYYIYGRKDNSNEFITNDEILISEIEEEKENTKVKIVVYIIGEIVNPGIVELDENSRISDAINKAGGLTHNADISNLNLAYVVEDGMKITIPSKNEQENENITEEELISTDSGIDVEKNKENTTKSELININKANQTELENLPGIGPSIALKIVNYRKEKGKFSKIEEIKNVGGIGDSKYENIKNLICVK